MTSASWDDIERVYLEAAGLPPTDCAAFLDRACVGQPSLRAQVESLLQSDPRSGSFLDVPPSRLAADLLENSSLEPGSIGPYRILRWLGEGGMGTVYQAEQQNPHRTVALKVIKAGLINDQVLRRFEQECEALGRLQHPGIAQIYDAGTADTGFGPQPYFAMEYIHGRPLMQDAAERSLDVRARLELVARICDAVNHAHQRGIIHRDLKPGNILVDETGQPKILDFGVARVADSAHATRHTDVGQLVGTLAYMSPEQAMGNVLEVDVRSDVYSLGVILYELLAGRLPYHTSGHSLFEAVKTIREKSPAPLSTVGRDYRGDIDVIAAKALEKDKEHRYATAGELAADIRRHLTDQPIVARPPTTTYQLWKFSKRHKAVVIGTAAVMVALIAGVIVSTLQAVRARTAERAALELFVEVRQLANSILFEINDAIKDLPGSTPARHLLVNRSLTYLDKLAQRASDDVSLQNELAVAYSRIGDVQYAVGGANLGDIAGALVSARKEVAIRDTIALRDKSMGAQLALAQAYQRCSELLEGTGSPAESVTYVTKALAVREALYVRYPGDARVRSAVASSYRIAGDQERLKGNPQGAVPLYGKALAVRRELVRQLPDDATQRRMMSIDMVRIADGLGTPGQPNLGRFAEALQGYAEALSIREALRQSSPGSVTAARDVANVLQRQGSLLVALKEYPQSLDSSRAALAILTPFWKADPANAEIRRDLAVMEMQIARAQDGMKDDTATENAYRNALAIYRELRQKDLKNDRTVEDLAGAMSMMGQWLRRHGRDREAVEHLVAARAGFDDLMQRNPEAGLYDWRRVRVIAGLADVHLHSGDRVSACAEYRDAEALGTRLQARGRSNAEDAADLSRFRKELASCQ